MDFERLADLLYPNITTLPEDMEAKYPPRDLPEGAKVTRFAPSPTGFIHLGNLYGALIDERLAHQSGGVFMLRIEDTDAKREVEGGVSLIIDMLDKFNIHFDEGATADGDNGAYGPYRQSQRKEIYQTYAKQLVREGHAYPCFCSPEELDAIRAEQESIKMTPGYYGKWAKWRDADIEAIEEKLNAGVPFVLRLRSQGEDGQSFKFDDLVKGKIDVTANFIDHVILKSDGIPDYHFAHAVDDHLMRTTHVVRDESWLPSLPFHIELFRTLGFKMPKYIHTAQVLKLDDGKKRKLSKRKDPEFAMSFFYASGYPVLVTTEYMMTLLNSNFEEWRLANPDLPYTDFPFTVKKMSPSGCLFDFDKLNDISKTILSKLSADEMYDASLEWAESFVPDFAVLLSRDPEYSKAILSIGRGGKKPRKDITVFSDLPKYMGFFFDELFTEVEEYPESFNNGDIKKVLSDFVSVYSPDDDQNQWFDKVKATAKDNGFCPDMKEYKANPDSYKGSVADVSMFLRVAITGRQNSPDLYTVMQILGYDKTINRLNSRMETL